MFIFWLTWFKHNSPTSTFTLMTLFCSLSFVFWFILEKKTWNCCFFGEKTWNSSWNVYVGPKNHECQINLSFGVFCDKKNSNVGGHFYHFSPVSVPLLHGRCPWQPPISSCWAEVFWVKKCGKCAVLHKRKLLNDRLNTISSRFCSWTRAVGNYFF